MLVVSSNWAVGDGTLVPAVLAWHGALPTIIHRAAIRGGVRDDGSYRPIEGLDLVLAGDTFDWLLSSEWQGATKPWHGTAAARERMTRVARRSIRAARRVLAPVVEWGRSGLRVPDRRSGRPGRNGVTVPVRVTLLAGDRDAAIEGLIGGRQRYRSVIVGSRWDDGRVAIRHGHEADPACRDGGRRRAATDRPPTLAESIGVDLVGRFATIELERTTTARSLVRSLAAAGTVGIPGVVAAWRGCGLLPDSELRRVGDSWQRAVDAWWHEARRMVPGCEAEFDAVDALASWYAAAFDADGGSPVGIERLRPRPPRGSPGLVLGHLVAEAGCSSPVCLGADAQSALHGPPAVIACRNAGGWPTWESLLSPDDASAVVAIRAVDLTARRDARVVDAA